jgi:hypothetical protein
VALGPARDVREAAGAGLQLEVFRSEARPRGTPEGLALAERMLTALGGAERWAQLSSVYTTGQAHVDGLPEPVGLRIWRDLDGRRLRLEQHVGGQRSVQVVTRESGWTRNQGSFSDLQDVLHERVVQREERQLFQLLYDLAIRRGVTVRQAETEQGAPERLELMRRRELLCWIELDAEDRPARLGYEGLDGEALYVFEEWTSHEGYPYPARVTQPHSSAAFEWDGFVPGPALEEDLFRRPVK